MYGGNSPSSSTSDPVSPAVTSLSQRVSYQHLYDIFQKEVEYFFASQKVRMPLNLIDPHGPFGHYARALEKLNVEAASFMIEASEGDRVRLAQVVKTTLTELFIRNVPPPTVISNEMGELGVMWQSRDKYVAIEFDSDGDAIFGMSDAGKVTSGTLVHDGNKVTESIDNLPHLIR